MQPRFHARPIRNISKKNLSIYLAEKRKVFSRVVSGEREGGGDRPA